MFIIYDKAFYNNMSVPLVSEETFQIVKNLIRYLITYFNSRYTACIDQFTLIIIGIKYSFIYSRATIGSGKKQHNIMVLFNLDIRAPSPPLAVDSNLEIMLGCLGTQPNVKIYSATVHIHTILN